MSCDGSAGIAMSVLLLLLLGLVGCAASQGITLTHTAIGQFVAGGTDAAQSTVVESLSAVTNNGVATSLITVTLLDAHGNEVGSGRTVVLVSNRSSTDTISGSPGTTNSYGEVTFAVSSTTSGTASFRATDTTDGVQLATVALVTFTSISASLSTVAVSPGTVVANGQSSATVTVVLKDTTGAVVAGKTLTLVSSRGATDSATPQYATTSSSGVAVFSVDSIVAGYATFTAVETTDNGLDLLQTVAVSFIAGAFSPSASYIQESASSVTAGSSVGLTVFTTDAFGNPVSGQSVTVVSSRASDQISCVVQIFATPGETMCSATNVNTASGPSVYSVVGFTSEPVSVTYTAAAESAFESTISIAPGTHVANGVSAMIVTVEITDIYNNPIGGKAVVLASSRNLPGGVVYDVISGPNPALTPNGYYGEAGSGAVTFTVVSDYVGPVTFTASTTS